MSPTTHAHPDMCQQQPSIKMLCVAERFLGRQQRQRNHKKKEEEREAEGGSYIITDGRPEALSSKNLKRNRQTNTTV